MGEFEDTIKDVVKWVGYVAVLAGPILSIFFEYPLEIPDLNTEFLTKVVLALGWINFIVFISLIIYIRKLVKK